MRVRLDARGNSGLTRTADPILRFAQDDGRFAQDDGRVAQDDSGPVTPLTSPAPLTR
jgi:hypothetical protein